MKPKSKRPTRIEKSFVMPGNTSMYRYIEIVRAKVITKILMRYSPKKKTTQQPLTQTIYYIMISGKGFVHQIEISPFQYKALVRGAGKPVINNRAMTKHVIKPYKQ